MSEYLPPTNDKLSINKKRQLFKKRNKMLDIPYNFSSSKLATKCYCGGTLDMKHIYECETEVILPYEKIYIGNIKEQIRVYQLFEKNLDKRTKRMSETELPCDPVVRCISSIG